MPFPGLRFSSLSTPHSDLLRPCGFTMIYFTTFILTLILSYVARAVPARGDAAPLEELYEPYEVTFDAQQAPPVTVYDVTWDKEFDDPEGSTIKTACKQVAHCYPHFNWLHTWPYICGSFSIKKDGSGTGCASCWNLTNLRTGKSIVFTAIDSTRSGFKLGKKVFTEFDGGKLGSGKLKAVASPVFCNVC